MKRLTLLLLSLLLAFGSLDAQNKQVKKMKIAVLDFKAGVGVNANEVEGLSDMLINSLFETRKFDIVERTQLYEVLKEQKLQGELTVQQCVKLGRILGVESVLIGTVNFLPEHKYADGSYSGEYNVDVRVVDVESGEIVTTAGATKSAGSTYRSMMEKIGKQLAANLMDEVPEPTVEVVEQPKKDSFRKSGFTLRPELGFVYGRHDPYYYYSYYYYSSMFGATADLAIGYQVGSHFFFGVVAGYGGEYHEHREYYGGIEDHTWSLIPLMADVRWYIINHKYTFVVDVQGGANLGNDGLGILKANAGFAFGNLETTAGVQYYYDVVGFNFNLSYRIGNIKWW